MYAEETKVLTRLIDIAEDIKNGELPSFVPALELEEMLPDLLELQNYIEALETDLGEARQDLDEAQYSYEELYSDYIMLDNEMDMMLEAYEEENE